jgi:2-dehydropantoate 2-reductase
MKYVVYGAGAIGGVIGARLAAQGIGVTLIARGAHLAAIRRTGLTLESPLGTATLPIPAVAHPSEIAIDPGDHVVLLAAKTQDAAGALDALREAAGTEVPVVCLQNGVEAARIALRRVATVYGAITMVPSAHLEPGVVQAFAAPIPGIVDVGRHPAGEDARIARVSADLRRAGFLSEVRADIARWQYGKLLDNLTNVLQALCGPDADYADLVAAVRAEGEACYRAAGIVPAAVRARAAYGSKLGTIGGRPRPGGSSWQSLARSTGSIETDFLNGEITLLGRLHGVPTPMNAGLQEVAARFARERRAPGSLPVAELRACLRT